MQDVLWRYFENDIENLTFRLNDLYWEEQVPTRERLAFVRHKERKFGRGCLQEWRKQQGVMLDDLEGKLRVCEEMLGTRDFLLDPQRPLFVDFDLFGMLGNFLYSGHYSLPVAHEKLGQWHRRMTKIKQTRSAREKLHT